MAQNFLIQADTQPWGLKYKTENGQFMEATARSRSKREEVNRGQRGKVTVRKRGDARGEQVPRKGGREGGAGPVARTVGGTREEGAAEAGVQAAAHNHQDVGAERVTRRLDVTEMP